MAKGRIGLLLFCLCAALGSVQADTTCACEGYVKENPFETMIRLGRMNASNPIYTMPTGSGGEAYVTSAITKGDAVAYPLKYEQSAKPGKYFIVVSKETSLVTRGGEFDLVITENVDPSAQTISVYTDWDRDGAYEKEPGVPAIDAAAKCATQAIKVPSDAELGKTRVRVRIEATAPESADAAVSEGRVYDFVLYVMDGDCACKGGTSCGITKSN